MDLIISHPPEKRHLASRRKAFCAIVGAFQNVHTYSTHKGTRGFGRRGRERHGK